MFESLNFLNLPKGTSQESKINILKKITEAASLSLDIQFDEKLEGDPITPAIEALCSLKDLVVDVWMGLSLTQENRIDGEEFLPQLAPVVDTIAVLVHDVHVRVNAQQILLQRVAESGGDGERDHQRHHTGGDPDNRYNSDNRDDGLLALGPQIAKCDEELELLQTLSSFLN